MIAGDLLRYVGVQVATKLMPTAGVFLFAYLLEPEDYGVLTLHLATVWIVALVLSMNLYSGIGRILFDPRTDTNVLLGTAATCLVALAMFAGGMVALARELIGSLTGVPESVVLLQIPIALGLIAELSLIQVLIYLRRSGRLLLVVSVKAALTLGLALFLTVQLDSQRYLGPVIAEAGVSAAFVLLVLTQVRSRASSSRFAMQYARRLASYSMPLIVYTGSLVVLSQSDRIIIARLVGTVEAGNYGLAYTFGALSLVAITPLLNAYQGRFFDAMNAGNTRAVGRDSEDVFAAGVLMVGLLGLWGSPILALVLPHRFHIALIVVPIVSVGALFQIDVLIRTRLLAYEDMTVAISMLMLMCALLNVGLNLWLVPKFGFRSAAVSTAAAQYLMLVSVRSLIAYRQLQQPKYDARLWTVTVVLLGLALCENSGWASTGVLRLAGSALVVGTVWPHVRNNAMLTGAQVSDVPGSTATGRGRQS